MQWLNIKISTLRSPQYMGSNPIKRATWLNVLAFCCDQENFGRIVGAMEWGDREWQQMCGVTRREVLAADKLLTVDGQDVVVAFYPCEKEAEVKAKSKAGSRGAISRWHSTAIGTANSTANSTAIGSAYAERKGKEGKEKGKEGESAAIPPVVEKSSTPETETEESNNVPTAKPCKWKCSMTGEELARKTFAMLQAVHGWQPDPSEVRFWGAQIDRALKCTGILKDAGEFLWFIGEYPKHADNPHFPQITKAYDLVDKLPKWNAYFKRGVA